MSWKILATSYIKFMQANPTAAERMFFMCVHRILIKTDYRRVLFNVTKAYCVCVCTCVGVYFILLNVPQFHLPSRLSQVPRVHPFLWMSSPLLVCYRNHVFPGLVFRWQTSYLLFLGRCSQCCSQHRNTDVSLIPFPLDINTLQLLPSHGNFTSNHQWPSLCPHILMALVTVTLRS